MSEWRICNKIDHHSPGFLNKVVLIFLCSIKLNRPSFELGVSEFVCKSLQFSIIHIFKSHFLNRSLFQVEIKYCHLPLISGIFKYLALLRLCKRKKNLCIDAKWRVEKAILLSFWPSFLLVSSRKLKSSELSTIYEWLFLCCPLRDTWKQQVLLSSLWNIHLYNICHQTGKKVKLLKLLSQLENGISRCYLRNDIDWHEGQGMFDSHLKVYVAGLVSFEYRR